MLIIILYYNSNMTNPAKRIKGLGIMRDIAKGGFAEAYIPLAMFATNPMDMEGNYKRAADAGVSEGLWGYSQCSFGQPFNPNKSNPRDQMYLDYFYKAAFKGSVDAMLMLGNICNRKGKYIEAYYWYMISMFNDHPEGEMSADGSLEKWKQAGKSETYEPLFDKFTKSNYDATLLIMQNDGYYGSSNPDILSRCVMNDSDIACYALGGSLDGVNTEKAKQIYLSLCQKGDAHALRCYADLLASEGDMNNAMKYYQDSAIAGERTAMFVMGEYIKQTSLELAGYWYGLSHTRGCPYALQRLMEISNAIFR